MVIDYSTLEDDYKKRYANKSTYLAHREHAKYVIPPNYVPQSEHYKSHRIPSEVIY